MFEPGSTIELVYPTITHVLRVYSAPRKVRQLYVHRVRDLVTEPLTIAEFTRRPYVARSRWLILASEWAGKPPRQFYVGTADNYQAPGVLRLALYEPDRPRPAKLLGRQFEPTVVDRQALLRLAIREAEKHDGYLVRIFAGDLRLYA
jgi:hypothetical protein